MPAPHAGEAGSIPARAAEEDDQVAQLVDARRSERRARKGLGVRPSPWSLKYCRRGRCPTGSHKAGAPGSIPGPATAGEPALIRASYAWTAGCDTFAVEQGHVGVLFEDGRYVETLPPGKYAFWKNVATNSKLNVVLSEKGLAERVVNLL